MKAKSESLRSTKPKRNPIRKHLPYADRRAQIVEKATVFFSEYGLTGQTRHLAAACGISQRLLYRYFPSKAALIDEVYREAIAKPFDNAWLVELEQRDPPLRQRLVTFYTRYAEGVLTRRWLRLFLYSALAENPMAPAYMDDIVARILHTVVDVSIRDLGLRPPADAQSALRIGWTLHGAIVLAGIRTHVYGILDEAAWRREIEVCVDTFLAGLAAQCAPRPKERRKAG